MRKSIDRMFRRLYLYEISGIWMYRNKGLWKRKHESVFPNHGNFGYLLNIMFIHIWRHQSSLKFSTAISEVEHRLYLELMTILIDTRNIKTRFYLHITVLFDSNKHMTRPVPLGFLINKFPFWDGAGLWPIRSVKHAEQGNSFFHSASKIVHIYFSP